MAEPTNSIDEHVDILIGSDFFWEFVSGAKVETPSGLFLIPSSLGFLLGGRSMTDVSTRSTTLLCITETFGTNCQLACGVEAAKNPVGRIKPDLEEFWALDKIGITDDPVTKDDDIALQKFNDTVYFEDGRYHVKWPWKDTVEHLPTNYDLALGRFKSLAKRLQSSDVDLLTKYQDVIDQQIRDNIIEKVTSESSVARKDVAVHYLPHHPVIKPGSATTKVRIVYDASARTRRDNPSLNECLYRGPVLLPDLCALLLRFRLPVIAIVADIEKAFLQVCLQPDDREVTRFLWFDDITRKDTNGNILLDGNMAIYRFQRVPFGVISSPFLLSGTVLYHLRQQDNWVAQQISKNIYVDNAISGCNTQADAEQMYSESKRIFHEAGMNLQEWSSNSSTLIDKIPQQYRAKQQTVKVLGMIWDTVTDRLMLKDPLESIPKLSTKRDVLHVVAAMYDPLGLFQPVFIKAKRFLQVLWQKNKSWDEQLSETDQSEIKQICADIKPVFQLSIPRNPTGDLTAKVHDIVVFSDSSKIAYAACVFVRRWDVTTSMFRASLVFSKSRLAPAKKSAEISLPRLELLGTTIGVRAGNFVREALEMPHIPIYLFTDSQCVLFWLQSSKTLSVFVENRIREIKSSLNTQFLFVKTSDNPADFCTRGMPGTALENCPMWWTGPEWLSVGVDQWDYQFECDLHHSTDASKEFRKCPAIHHTLVAGEVPDRPTSHPMGIDVSRFSSFRKLKRVSAWVLKALKKIIWSNIPVERRPLFPELCALFDNISSESYITRADVAKVKVLLVKWIQKDMFEDVLHSLAHPTQRPHPLVRQLGLGIDHDGIMRCYGRFEHADLTTDAMQPKLLPKISVFTDLVIKDIHERLLHAGIGHTLSQIRREFWVPQGRMATRKVVKRCLLCRRYNSGPFKLPPMPPWPRERMSPSSPFRFTGLDYLGPITVKIGENGTQKVWVCLFTCLAVRAIHLEWVADCSAKEFLGCLTRFISRRGTPERIICDNAPQFRVVKAVFDRVWHSVLIHNDVLSFVADKGIDWSFITELAPWQGGFYERLVGLVKRSFRFAIGRRLLHWTEFITLCCEVEALLNSRPITYVHSDLDSSRALRPIDFLTDLPVGSPETSQQLETRGFGEAGKQLLQYWKFKQTKLQSLWEFWQTEYLLNLRERGSIDHRRKRGAVESAPVVDEVVLVKDGDIPRGAWKLGRVTVINTSDDGKIRSVEVQLPNKSTIRRSVGHLYPIEVPALDGNQSIMDTDDEAFDGFTMDEVNEVTQRVAAHMNKPKQ